MPKQKPAILEFQNGRLELDYSEKTPRGKKRRLQFHRAHAGGFYVHITDPSGIGSGILRRVRGEWPAKIQLRLELTALEGLSITVGDRVVPRKNLAICLLNPAGKPLAGKHRLNRPGYYEATIPSAALKGATEIKISWVDFYR